MAQALFRRVLPTNASVSKLAVAFRKGPNRPIRMTFLQTQIVTADQRQPARDLS